MEPTRRTSRLTQMALSLVLAGVGSLSTGCSSPLSFARKSQVQHEHDAAAHVMQEATYFEGRNVVNQSFQEYGAAMERFFRDLKTQLSEARGLGQDVFLTFKHPEDNDGIAAVIVTIDGAEHEDLTHRSSAGYNNLCTMGSRLERRLGIGKRGNPGSLDEYLKSNTGLFTSARFDASFGVKGVVYSALDHAELAKDPSVLLELRKLEEQLAAPSGGTYHQNAYSNSYSRGVRNGLLRPLEQHARGEKPIIGL